jgi:hypothetical protein
MADQKISELTALTGANVADTDLLPIVDTSATETKKITFGEFKTALDTATGFVRITGDTMTGALDVQSTITADGLTVDGVSTLTSNSSADGILLNGRSDNIGQFTFRSNDGATNYSQLQSRSTEMFVKTLANIPMSFHTNNTKRLGIANNGDISFYEDTGTTAKFFWDASAESLSVGKNSLSYSATDRSNIEIKGTASALLALQSGNENSYLFKNGTTLNIHNQSSGSITFDTAATEAMVIDSSGNVNITGGNLSVVGQVTATGGAVSAPTYSFISDTDTGISRPTTNAVNIVTAGTERMRIDSSGNVGIGRTPSVVESTYDSLQLGAGGTWLSGSTNLAAGNFGQNYYIDASGDNLYLGNDEAERIVLNNGYIAFETAPTNASGAGAALTWSESMRIDSSGNVLVGVTGTGELGVTNQGVLLRDGFIQVAQTGTTSATLVYFYNGNGQVGGISTSGSTTTYATSSDYRLKTDAQPMTGASDRVLALKPVNFEWLSDGTRVDGFLAHEAQAVVPECVTGTKDAMRDEEYEVTAAIEATYDEDGNELTAAVPAVMGTRSVPDYQGIDQSKLVPLLTAALQEALTKIADMEIRLSALEG